MEPEDAPSSMLSRSQFFTLRVWYDERAPGERELRVQLRHVLTGEIHYFHDWSAIQGHIAALFDAPNVTP